MGEKLDLRTAKFHIIGTSEPAPEVGSISEKKDTLFIKQVSTTEFEVFASDDKGQVLSVSKSNNVNSVENSFFKKLGVWDNSFDDVKYTNGGLAINTSKNEGVLTVQMDSLNEIEGYDLEYSFYYRGYMIQGFDFSNIIHNNILVLKNRNRYSFRVEESQREGVYGPMGSVRFIVIEDPLSELDFEGKDRVLEGVKFTNDLYYSGEERLAVFGEGAYQTTIRDNGMLNLSEEGVRIDSFEGNDFRILVLDHQGNVKALHSDDFKSEVLKFDN